MALDLSEYVDKYIPLKKEKLTIEEMASYLASEGYVVTKIVDSPKRKLVYVNDKYHVTLRGFVKVVGRNKETFNAWEKEWRLQQVRKGVSVDKDFYNQFAEATDHAPFSTWVKSKMAEEVYGSWQSKLVPPKDYELVNGMVIVDDGETISFCHISEFHTKQFKLWTRIPPRSITESRQHKETDGRR